MGVGEEPGLVRVEHDADMAVAVIRGGGLWNSTSVRRGAFASVR
ncbi:hypothetical protein GA0061093_14216 [Rhodococcus qingshengii]|nr:hypothetical protein GA0061093_14216 [Rhodococcus qingshengii]